jgi:hypothetical protein
MLSYLTTSLRARSHIASAVLLPAFAFACFGFVHSGHAQCPEVCDSNSNTGLGTGVLGNNPTGQFNTAVGALALRNDQGGSDNTAVGDEALHNNTSGTGNIAVGSLALEVNTIGNYNTAVGLSALGLNKASQNTAIGAYALEINSSGNNNVATGFNALFSNTGGYNNTATGFQALYSNTGDSAFNNTATGSSALQSNTSGNTNTADGAAALFNNKTGNTNTAEGAFALSNNTSGSSNIALGYNAGSNLTTGSNNIDIGNNGVAGEAGKIRIGKNGTQTATYIAGIYSKGVASATGVAVKIDSTGKLGTVLSSARYKEAIKPMDKASEALLALKPVTFRYKQELDPDGVRQFGLIAEEVEKVDPDLVVRDDDGKVSTVRYEAVNAMLLNEFLKEHRAVQEQQSRLEKQEMLISKQQRQIEALTAGLQKVSAKVELHEPPVRTAANDQ